MNNAETKLGSELLPEATLATDTLISQWLHDVKNQLGGVELYAAVLKKSLANNTLDVAEGIAICDKIIRQIDELAARTKAAARSLGMQRTRLYNKLSKYKIEVARQWKRK